MRQLAHWLAPAVLAAAALAPASAGGQILSAPAAAETLVVCKDKSVAFRLAYPVGQIVVAQPEVLQLVAVTDQSFYVRGKALGSTNLLVYDKQHRLMQVIDVKVGYDLDGLRQDLKTALPAETITVANFGGGVLLRGEVPTLRQAARAEEIAQHYAPHAVSSEIQIKAAEQVMVEVRIIEANRAAMKDIGVDLNAHNNSHFTLNTGQGIISNQPPMGTMTLSGMIHGVSIEATLTALEQKGLVRTLAKPNLIAMSGEEASFLAGGEFPYPVPAGVNLVTIEFKPFGVKLKITPEVQANGQIKLKVNPEVSELDPQHHLQIGGFDMPALIERKAQTVVALKDGQSFAIAGLFQQDYVNAVNQVPWAADVPILGALFKSTSWKRNESELVIIVTPHLTAPADSLDQLPNPLSSPNEPDPIGLLLTQLSYDQPMAKPITKEGRR